jgi:hypothetical protein
MLKEDLKVVILNITEDYYDYGGTCTLCGEDKFLDIELTDLNEDKIAEIKDFFKLDGSVEEIEKDIMQKILEMARIESRHIE